MATFNGFGFLAVAGGLAEESLGLWVLEEFIFKPHLAGLGKRPNLIIIIKRCYCPWIFACGKDTEAILWVCFGESLVEEESA